MSNAARNSFARLKRASFPMPSQSCHSISTPASPTSTMRRLKVFTRTSSMNTRSRMFGRRWAKDAPGQKLKNLHSRPRDVLHLPSAGAPPSPIGSWTCPISFWLDTVVPAKNVQNAADFPLAIVGRVGTTRRRQHRRPGFPLDFLGILRWRRCPAKKIWVKTSIGWERAGVRVRVAVAYPTVSAIHAESASAGAPKQARQSYLVNRKWLRCFKSMPALAFVWLVSANLALAQQRFPPPDFESGHRLPLTATPAARAQLLQYGDVAVLALCLGLASWLVF